MTPPSSADRSPARAPAAGSARSQVSGWIRWSGFALALVVVTLLGRALLMPGTNLALYWPAAGVAVLGVAAARSTRELRVVCATTLAIAALGNLVTGVPLLAALVLGLANAVTGLTPALLLAYAPAPLRSRHGGRGRPLGERLRVVQVADLPRVFVAIVLGACASSVVGSVALALMGGTVTPLTVVSWIVRLGIGGFVVAAPLLTLACTTRHRVLPTQPSSAAAWRTWGRERAVETTVITVGGTAVLLAVFLPSHDLPITYVPVAVAVWAGVRLPPAVAGLICFALGLLTGLLVLFAGGGPFAGMSVSPANVMSVQGFALLLVGVSLLLSLVIAERDGLSERLSAAQQEATQRADDLSVITDTVPTGLMVVLEGGGLELMNPPAATMAFAVLDERGAPREGWRRPDGTLLAPDEFPIARALRGEPVHEEVVREPEGLRGRARSWSIDAVSLPPREDGRRRVLLSFRNVTDEQEQLAALESFAGVVAHDLQNPVTAIKGWTDVVVDELDLAETDQDAGVRRAIDRVRRATDRASELIRDLLHYSLGRTAAVERRRVDLDELAARVQAAVEESYADRGPQISVGPLGDYPGDPVLLEQVLMNIVGNAVKYTPPDRVPVVEVSAERLGGELRLEIGDHGVGIPAADRQRIFEPFERAHGGDTRFTGTGLGLAICSQAVHRHGGRIRVEDREDGEGSRFVIDLPLVKSEHDEDVEDVEEVEAAAAAPASSPDAQALAAAPLPTYEPASIDHLDPGRFPAQSMR